MHDTNPTPIRGARAWTKQREGNMGKARGLSTPKHAICVPFQAATLGIRLPPRRRGHPLLQRVPWPDTSAHLGKPCPRTMADPAIHLKAVPAMRLKAVPAMRIQADATTPPEPGSTAGIRFTPRLPIPAAIAAVCW